MEIINATPHAISYYDAATGDTTTYQPSGIVPRVAVEEAEVKSIRFPFKAFSKQTGKVEGLPPIQENTLLIVSGMVFEATSRRDVIAPNTGASAIRNEKGHIQAVTSFYVKGV